MSLPIKYVKCTMDGTEQKILPVTSTKAVYDEDGVRLDQKLAEVQNKTDSVGDSSLWIVPQNDDEINFGGVDTTDRVHFGFREVGSRPRPKKFVFGYNKGTATDIVGSSDVYAAHGTFSGTYANVDGRYGKYAGVEIRENDLVGNTQTDIGHAPTLGFHWANTAGGTLALGSDGKLNFNNTAGNKGTIVANVEGNATYASTAGSAPASDVYAWAKASSKPGYSWGEISGKPSTFSPASHGHSSISSGSGSINVSTPSGGRTHALNFQNDGNLVLSINGTAKWNSGTFQSSAKYKENIEDMTEERARQILNVRPVTYDMKPEYRNSLTTSATDRPGVIAEELDEVMPDLVVHMKNDDGGVECEAVEYQFFTPYLIKMVQMQQKQIDELYEIIEKMKAEK